MVVVNIGLLVKLTVTADGVIPVPAPFSVISLDVPNVPSTPIRMTDVELDVDLTIPFCDPPACLTY